MNVVFVQDGSVAQFSWTVPSDGELTQAIVTKASEDAAAVLVSTATELLTGIISLAGVYANPQLILLVIEKGIFPLSARLLAGEVVFVSADGPAIIQLTFKIAAEFIAT